MSRAPIWKAVGKNSFWVFLATFSLAFTQWAIMAIIARLDGPAALGEYALAQAFANPAGYLAWLNIRQQYVISRLEGGDWIDFLFLRMTVPLVVFSLVVLGASIYYQDWQLIEICAGVFFLKYSEGLFDLSYGRLQNERRMISLGLYSTIRAAVSIPMFYVAYEQSGSIYYSLVILSLINIVFYGFQSVLLGMPLFGKGFISADHSVFQRRIGLIRHLLPFAVSTVMMALVTSIPRFLLEQNVGATDLGRFAAVAHFVAIGSVVVGSMTHAIAPIVASAIDREDEKTFWSVLFIPALLLQGLCCLAIVIALFFGNFLVGAIYGNAFRGDGSLLAWAAVAAGPVYFASITGVGCYVFQMKRVFFSIHAGGLLIIAFVTEILVGALGPSSAFIAMAVCGILQVFAFSAAFVFAWRGKRRFRALAII